MNSQARPFGQSDAYSFNELGLTLPLRERVYKFTILLPEQDSGGNAIFSALEREDLSELLDNDFGGHTRSTSPVQPLFSGGYVNEQRQHVIDFHTRYEVYAKQPTEAVRYFTDLGKNLAQHSRTVIAGRMPDWLEYKGEEQIFIEYMPVLIIDTWLPF